jgi:ABC-2 type transport system ATP-binding protein
MMQANELIQVEGLNIRRGTFSLDIGKWSLAPGQVIGLVGPNGAGKTTLLEALAGLRPLNGGSARVLGKDPWIDPVTVRSSLGFMTDNMPLFAMKAGPLMEMLSGYYPNWDGALVADLMDRFRIDPGKHVAKLSRGQGTRLRLITAMAFRPRILLLDEPAAGLDLAGRRTLLDSVLEVVRDPARSVIISSHLLADVERIADRLLVLDHGKVVQEGSTDDLVGDDRTLEEALIEWGAAG